MSDSAGGPAEVLVVEDDAEMLKLVQRVLEEEGYHVTATSGVTEALGLLREQGYDLVVTDLFQRQGRSRCRVLRRCWPLRGRFPWG